MILVYQQSAMIHGGYFTSEFEIIFKIMYRILTWLRKLTPSAPLAVYRTHRRKNPSIASSFFTIEVCNACSL